MNTKTKQNKPFEVIYQNEVWTITDIWEDVDKKPCWYQGYIIRNGVKFSQDFYPSDFKTEITLKDLLHEVRNDGLYDGWGDCLSWLFSLADYLTDQGFVVPSDWEFKQSPLGSNSEDYNYQTLVELKPSEDVLSQFGEILWRYRSMLKQAEKDY